MRFRYLRDPLFLIAVAAYLANRWVLKAARPGGFAHDHLNDLVCVPVWVPVMLWAQRRAGLRASDGPPQPAEVVVPVVVWAWAFEVVVPASGVLGRRSVPDPGDVLCYALGALGAGAFWRWWYGGSVAGDPTAG